MLKEALELLAKQSVAAASPQFKDIDPTKTHAFLDPTTGVKVVPGIPPWRKHQARDLQTVVDFAKRFAGAKGAVKSAVWYNRDAAVCLVDDGDRRERVEFRLSPSPQREALKEMEKRPAYEQRQLILLLRSVFKDCLGRNPDLVNALRSVKWKQGSEADVNIGRGKSSIGKTLAAEAAGLDTLPEYVTLSVPIFAEGSLAGIWADVECVLEINETTCNVQLFPVPGKLELAVSSGEGVLGKTLADGFDDKTPVPIYYGTP